MGNKIKYGLKNAHYAVLNETTGVYGTPVRLPGAISMSMQPTGDTKSVIADDIEYYTAIGNNGYDGTLELSIVPDDFRVNCLGYKWDGDGVLFEDPDAQPTPFALLFEFNGDIKATKHVMYKCKATRPNIESAATTNKETKSETLTLMARPNADNIVKANSIAATGSAVTDAWYDAVFEV